MMEQLVTAGTNRSCRGRWSSGSRKPGQSLRRDGGERSVREMVMMPPMMAQALVKKLKKDFLVSSMDIWMGENSYLK